MKLNPQAFYGSDINADGSQDFTNGLLCAYTGCYCVTPERYCTGNKCSCVRQARGTHAGLALPSQSYNSVKCCARQSMLLHLELKHWNDGS